MKNNILKQEALYFFPTSLKIHKCFDRTATGVSYGTPPLLTVFKNRPVGAEFLHVHGQTDGRTSTLNYRYDAANSLFSQFSKRA
jgi:hypothetical protein